MKRSEIRVRDPFIVLDNDTYYLYATTGEKTHSYYTSKDLNNWEYGGVTFEIPDNFWANKDVWAGEVHKYCGKFYLFVSLLGKNGLRGTQVSVSDKPSGPFIPLKNGPVTPTNQSCIDGTLYVENGKPYIIYSHDWPDNYLPEKQAYMGEICIQELSLDLKEGIGEPSVLFSSDESPISAQTPHHMTWEGKKIYRYGSDGPFLHKLSSGKLMMIWSPYLQDHYVVLKAYSQSGSVKGPWVHEDKPLFDNDGGHGMIFKDKDGKYILSIHSPEKHNLERAHLFELGEKDDSIVILKEIDM